MTWEDVFAFAAGLPGTERTTHYGGPAIKANGHPIVTPSREADSFCLHIDRDMVEMLKETDPATFWQTPHYEGWPSVLVRYASDDPDRVLAMIGRAHQAAMARSARRPRKA
ncbi:MmcQ/YjbR family DNA-binding protein [Sphingomonas sp.]|uniref:MmcQ/YjbR family DNA-binding protein n=1 Tax=Sphingomonas sp. TaxID=28214 RepID=UPI000DB21BCC|nr:MmcQ/YjbR family DNA-binding protein [Sphingomonas sp.]PZU06609.1 MAG: hypothetical protein DI605_18525 [Sphingomonas sp.]